LQEVQPPIPGAPGAPAVLAQAMKVLPPDRFFPQNKAVLGALEPENGAFNQTATGPDGASVTAWFNVDKTLFVVECEVDKPVLDVTMRQCTDLNYTGANPAAARAFASKAFAELTRGKDGCKMTTIGGQIWRACVSISSNGLIRVGGRATDQVLL
jgi:hypothetical protein